MAARADEERLEALFRAGSHAEALEACENGLKSDDLVSGGPGGVLIFPLP